MANVQKADVVAFIADLKTFLETAPILGNIFERRRRINNRQDYVAKLGKLVSSNYEIRFSEIEFLKITDSAVEGDDDCPVAILTFGIHVFTEFADLRADGSNSADDFVDMLFTIRDLLLNRRDFAAGNYDAKTQPVIMPEFAQFGNDGFTDAFGHSTDLTLEVNFYDPEQ